MKDLDPSDVQDAFEIHIPTQMARLRRHKRIPRRGLTVVIDMHKKGRYDRTPGVELMLSKAKDGTVLFERYMRAQCVDPGLRIVLAGQYLKNGDPCLFVGKLLDATQEAGIKVRLVLLDREFFSVYTISCLERHGMACRFSCRAGTCTT